MAYLSLYRKYRSQTFSDLIGQDHVVRTLQNGITSGRIAHSYLFTGPRGTGKTSTARLLAKALNCEHGPTGEPDNTCEICLEITAGICIDVLEMDAASESGVDDVRDKIVDVSEYKPNYCRYKVFIIDEVHDLSAKAFDALLKTIEEPPSHVVFILATTEYNKVPATIRSRCQKHEFHRASMADLVARLAYVAKAEEVEVEPAALTAIARMADGGYRDALTLLEQAIIVADGKVTLQQVYDQLGLISDELVDSLLVALRETDVPKILDVSNEVARLGRDPRAILESMMYRLADLTRAAYGVEIGVSPDAMREANLHETATRIGRDALLAFRGAIAEAHKEIRDVSLPRVWLESELIRICTLGQVPSAGAMVSIPAVASVQDVRPREVAVPAANGANKPTVVTRPAPQPTVVAATGDPEIDASAAKWARVVADLSALSKTMAIRLNKTRVVAVSGKKVQVEFERRTDCEWMQDSPAKVAAIQKQVIAAFGEDWSYEFTADKVGPQHIDPVAVELPAEGQRLDQLVREEFSSPSG